MILQRPIVAFSIENQSILNMKKRKMMRSRQRNPLCNEYKSEEVPAKKVKLGYPNMKKLEGETIGLKCTEPDFAGELAKPGQKVSMRKNYKLKEQAQEHMQAVRKEKREIKMGRSARRVQHLKQRQVEKKTKKRKKTSAAESSAFANLVNSYKSKFQILNSEKNKWYDG